jgi:hypothetical protein
MQTFPKQQIAEWILLDYLAKSHYRQDKIDFFESLQEKIQDVKNGNFQLAE